MNIYLLDVASGPIFLIFGFFLLVIIAVLGAIIFFAVRAIRKIKKDVEK